MKFRVVIPFFLACLAVQAGRMPASPLAMYQADSKAPQSLSGCVDEQNGHYVLLDDKMVKIANLQSAGSDPEVFAKRLGQRVLVKGTQSSGRKNLFTVTSIEELSGSCGPAK